MPLTAVHCVCVCCRYLLTRGQQIKVMSQLYRKVRPLNLLLPVASRKSQEGDKFEGRP